MTIKPLLNKKNKDVEQPFGKAEQIITDVNLEKSSGQNNLNIEALADIASQSLFFRDFIKYAKEHKLSQANGVIKPSRPLIAAGIQKEICQCDPLLWITNSSDSAERLCQDLACFLPKGSEICLFPEKDDSPILGGHTNASDPARLSILQTVETHRNIRPFVIVAPIRAILQPTVKIERLEQGKITVHKGEKIDSGLILELLLNEGYTRVTMVERRGEVSQRGDIVDIYPVTGKPVRMELFGDEVESIRTINLDTQRSTGEVEEVILLPAKVDESDEKSAWLTSYLAQRSKKTCVILEEPSQLRLAAQEWYHDWAGEGGPDVWQQVDNMLSPFKKIQLSAWSGSTGMDEKIPTFQLQFEQENVFANRIDDMLAKVPQWQKENNKIVIISRHYARLLELFNANSISPIVTSLENGLNSGQILLQQGYVSEGFRLQLDATNLIFLTDRELVGQRRQRSSVNKAERGSLIRINELSEGDLVVHLQHGIGRYLGVTTVSCLGSDRDFIKLEYLNKAFVYLPVDQLDLVQPYKGLDNKEPKLSHMNGTDWSKTKAKIRENTEKIAQELLKIYAKRQKTYGYAFGPDTDWQREVEDAFAFQETPDQMKAIIDVKTDMESPHPMDRLVCGDVGYGKTEVALRAAFKAVVEDRQVAVLVPTTVLAQQHYQTFCERLAPHSVKIGLLSRFRSAKEQKETAEQAQQGQLDIVIGTHRILSKDVSFKKLGLLIIDEEHKFGVKHKERLKELRSTVDVLSMSATPIPRTLQMSLYGIHQMSVIETPPEDRLPIKTYMFQHNPELIKAAITRELSREGQIYFVHNRVQGIERVAADIQRLVPQARIAVGHGQMAEGKLEKVMVDFFEGEYDILVCTTIIESGLDIPNVNTIIINNANMFGLAQLYQLRGRVGRSSKQGYCYLLHAPTRKLTREAECRLETIRDFTQLGAGYQVARRDLEIRGAGNILGAEQSGHVAAVGFDLYCRMLNEAVAKLRGDEIQQEDSINNNPINLDIPVSASLPEYYVGGDSSQKVLLYKRMANLKDEKGLLDFKEELKDRFGRLPLETNNLLKLLEIKFLCREVMASAIKINGSLLTIVMPFLGEVNKNFLYRISKKAGWVCHYANMSLIFEGLYGRAAGSVTLPCDYELLHNIIEILKYLKEVAPQTTNKTK